MDKFPLLWEGRAAGELAVQRDEGSTWFSVRCRPPASGLWCAWAVGESGELRLGLLAPEGEGLSLRRRFSQRMTQPAGRLLRGELRPAGKGAGDRPPAWESVSQPDALFSAPPWPQDRLRGISGALCRREERRLLLALPWDHAKPFPLVPLFCFAQIRTIEGKTYAVYCFGPNGEPLFYR